MARSLPAMRSIVAGFVLAFAMGVPAAAFEDLRFRLAGGDAELKEKLRIASLLRTARDDGLSDPFEVYTVARAEYGHLIGLFYEAGYYAPVISIRIDGREAADISPLSPPARIGRVEVQMDAGPAFVFGRAQIGPLAPGTLLPPDFRPGAPARSTLIRDAAEAAVDGWRDQGHAQAQPDGQQITARHPPGELDVAVSVAPGPRLTFGRLRPEGQQRTRIERIRAIAGLPEGEVYSPQQMRRAAERLRETGTFSSVALRDAPQANPDGSLDVTAALVEAPPRRIGFGAEYDTEDGARLISFWLHRNLSGGAERFRIEGELRGIGGRDRRIDYRLGVELARPATFTPDTTLRFSAYAESENRSDFEASRARIDLALLHRYSENLRFSGGVGTLAERARFGPGKKTRRDFRLLLLPLDVTWDRRDDERNATTGTFAQLGLTPFIGFAGADNGARSMIDLRAYRASGADSRVVVAARLQAGALFGAAIERTPRDFLFYSGGGGTVRGQRFQSLGVTVNGVDSGGRGFAALSLETRVRVTETIGVVAFADAGRVWDGPLRGASDWHSGAGLGVRYDSVIGPLRLDVGLPVRGGPRRRGVQLYLGIGQAF